MKSFGIVLLLLAVAAPLGAQSPPPAPTPLPPLDTHQAAYLFGLGFGEQLHEVGVPEQIAIEDIARGIKDGLQGKRTSPDDRRQVLAYVHSQSDAMVSRNQAAAKEFLARKGRDKGVVTTTSGLEYEILAPGDPKSAAITSADTVTVHYRGKLLDGSEFDSSYERGSPTIFQVNGVIPGWQEALVLMKPGAKWRLYVPPELGYRNVSRPGIPGGSLLIFDIDLLSVKSGAPPPASK